MYKIVTFLLCLLIGNAIAENELLTISPVRVLKLVEKGLKPPEQPCSERPEQTKSNYYECLKEVCGKPPQFISLWDRHNAQEENLTTSVTKKADPILKDIESKINKYFELEGYDPFSNADINKKLLTEINHTKKNGVQKTGKSSFSLILIDLKNVLQNIKKKEDATYSAFGNIMLSYTLAKGPTYYQKGVIFHEIAHNVERIFNKRKDLSKLTIASYSSTRQCFEGIHNYLDVAKTGQYFSEDFADFIAIKILPPKTKSPDCEYLSYSSELDEYDEEYLKNTIEDSSHSSLIFRVIRASIDSGTGVPNSCKEALLNDGVIAAQPCNF